MSLIIFEDDHLLVINKPAGWNTHAPDPFAGEGVFDWLKHRESRWAKLAIIHRLDKETSGVLVFGKTTEANRSLTLQFSSRKARKRYLLLTDRAVPSGKFSVRSTIVRAGERYRCRSLQPGGELAETHFNFMASRENLALVEAEPITGRTHQIRAHAAERGFPILGDTLYGGTRAARVFLHAGELTLTHPVTGATLTFHAPCQWCAENVPLSSCFQRTHDVAIAGLRAGVIDSRLTDSFRLIHGASDHQPGLYVDKLGDFLLAESEAELGARELGLLEAMAGECGARGVYHKFLNRNIRRTATRESAPRCVLGELAPERFAIRENGLSFEISFNEGYSVGLFLDQRDNRRRLQMGHIGAAFPLARARGERGPLLNIFAYTCGFSVAAAASGMITTSLDLSKKYLEWGKRNFALNNLDPAQHDFVFGDAFDWMRRFGKKGRTFACVVLDPPTFSQSKESGTWQAEKDYGKLVEAAVPLLEPGGVLFASTNAAKLSAEDFLAAIQRAISGSGRKITQQHYVPQPPDFPITRAEPAYLKTAWLRVS